MTVPIGYIVGVSIVAWATLMALAPMRTPRALGLVSWGSSMVLNEVPFIAFTLLAASTILAIAGGDLDSLSGAIALGYAALVTSGLIVVAWRGTRARPAVDRAMDEGLGIGWRATIAPGLAARLRRVRPWGRILSSPWVALPRDVERVKDISYGDSGANNRLDLYRQRGRQPGSPTLVYFHGGGFRHGGKSREARPLIYHLARQGWVAISANYRIGPTARFPDHVVDAKRVIAWVRAHGHEYGADTTRLFVAGSSAGGYLAAMSGLTANDPLFQPSFEHADTTVTAAVALYGYFGALDTDGPRPSSPEDYVRADAPPFFVAHGDHDTYVPVEVARRFVDRLRAVSSNPVVYAELPGAQHSFDLVHSMRMETVVDAIEAFAAWVTSQTSALPADPSRHLPASGSET